MTSYFLRNSERAGEGLELLPGVVELLTQLKVGEGAAAARLPLLIARLLNQGEAEEEVRAGSLPTH